MDLFAREGRCDVDDLLTRAEALGVPAVSEEVRRVRAQPARAAPAEAGGRALPLSGGALLALLTQLLQLAVQSGLAEQVLRLLLDLIERQRPRPTA